MSSRCAATAGATPIFLAMQSGEVDGQIINLSSVRTFAARSVECRQDAPADAIRPPDAARRRRRRSDRARARSAIRRRWPCSNFAEQPFFMALPVRAAPPEVPADRVAALRKAFMEMTRDPAFLEEVRVGHFRI